MKSWKDLKLTDEYLFSQIMREEGLSEGIQKGREEGLKEGRDKGILQTAAAALKQGVPPETVAAFTGLSPTRLEELQRSM